MKISFQISLDKVVRTLIASDIAFSTGWGFIAPIFAIFIIGQVEGGNVAVAGFAVGLYWL